MKDTDLYFRILGLTELSFSEASVLYEKLLKDGPNVLARLVSRVSDE